MTSPTAPQSLSGERREEVRELWCFNGGSIYKPLWAAHTTDEYRCTMDDPNFWSFISALDAQHAERTTQFQRRADGLSKDFTALQHAIVGDTGKFAILEAERLRRSDDMHAERTRAAVEKMREAAILQIQAEAAATEDGETLESLNRVIERLRALSIEGTGQ